MLPNGYFAVCEPRPRRREGVFLTTPSETANFFEKQFDKKLSFGLENFCGIVESLGFCGLFAGGVRIFALFRYECYYVRTNAKILWATRGIPPQSKRIFTAKIAHIAATYAKNHSKKTALNAATAKKSPTKKESFCPALKAGGVNGEKPLPLTAVGVTPLCNADSNNI